jgi:hypothetical protein
MHRKAVVVLFAVAVLACAGFAQDKPSLSGAWKLDVAKSDFGPVPGPTSQTDTIEQNGQTIKISVSAEGEQGKQQFTITYVTDGKEVTVAADAPAAHPAPEVTMQTISSAWEGAVLVVHQKLTYGTEPVTGVSRYTLSPDGEVLTVNSDYASQMGDATRTFVFEKAGSAAAAAAAASAATSSTASSGASASSSMGASTSMSAPSSASSATSSTKPNLSGTWVLDVSKSDLGQMPAPDSRTDTIEHKEPSFKVTVNQTGGALGQMTFTLNAVTDGKTVSTWTIFGSDAKSTAQWDGNTLVVHTDTKIQEDPTTFVSRYTLSPDGNTLNVQGHFSGPMGEGDTKLVYTKK